jgi:hypothetical protein
MDTNYETVDYQAAGELAQAAAKAAKSSRRVVVIAEYETEPKTRVLKWDGARPYVITGGYNKYRQYLTSFEVGSLVTIFRSKHEL